MVFVSPIFLFLFLPAFLALYYITPARFRSLLIVIGSSIFYAWWRIDFLFLIYAIILWNWFFGRVIDQYRDRRHGLHFLQIAVLGNLLTLGYLKYCNFGVETLRDMFGDDVLAGFAPVVLPIGISFFVFHAVSYVVDIWRRDTKPAENIIDFAAFITLFPHMIAGPILKFKDLSQQFVHRVHSVQNFSEGAYRFMVGFSQKILIADMIAPLADAAFDMQDPSMADAWLGVFSFSLQLFFDFAGYSNMAIGLALMMGFRFIENFNSPYLSRSITEFWHRWHISLSTWLRDYVYIPLGGNRKGRRRLLANLFLTMAAGGLWHGASWTFVLWGMWHGILLAAERISGLQTHSRILTFVAVMIGWVLFRSADISAAMDMYGAMAGAYGFGFSDNFYGQIKGFSVIALAVGTAVIFMMPLMDRYSRSFELSKGNWAVQKEIPAVIQISIFVVFIAAVTRMAAMNFSPFLYFQF